MDLQDGTFPFVNPLSRELMRLLDGMVNLLAGGLASYPAGIRPPADGQPGRLLYSGLHHYDPRNQQPAVTADDLPYLLPTVEFGVYAPYIADYVTEGVERRSGGRLQVRWLHPADVADGWWRLEDEAPRLHLATSLGITGDPAKMPHGVGQAYSLLCSGTDMQLRRVDWADQTRARHWCAMHPDYRPLLPYVDAAWSIADGDWDDGLTAA